VGYFVWVLRLVWSVEMQCEMFCIVGYIITKIFHPNVSKAGEVCVNTLKKDWNKDLGINHILLVCGQRQNYFINRHQGLRFINLSAIKLTVFILLLAPNLIMLFFYYVVTSTYFIIRLSVKCLLIFPNPESALNEEAGRLLLENYEDYAKHARLMTKIHASTKPNDVSFTEPSSQNASSPSPSTSSSQSKKSTSKDVRDGVVMSDDKSDEAHDTKGERKSDVKDGNSDQNEQEQTTNVHSATSPLGVSNSINEGISLKKNAGESVIAVTPRKRAAEEKRLEKKQIHKNTTLKRL
jgi:hypothetical protein